MSAPTLFHPREMGTDGDSDIQSFKSESLTTAQFILLGGLAAAAAGQGGFYIGPRLMVTATLAAAGTLHFRRRGGHVAYLRQPVILALGALAGWAVISAFLAGHPMASLSMVSVIASFGVVAVIVGEASRAQRRQLAKASIALGAAVAMSGWIGVAFRLTRWASPESGLWRAETTVTYTNAAAAVMAALALLAIAMLVGRSSVAGRVAAMVLILGVGATLSRAAIVGLALGYCVLLGLLGVRRVVGATAGIVVGAAIAAIALTFSMPVRSDNRAGLAILGLLVGAGVAMAPTLTGRRATGLAVAALALALCGAAIGLSRSPSSSGSAGPAGWNERISISSPSRGQETRAALALVRAHLLTGTGPGQATFLWSTPDRHLLVDSYAHDEYLQLAAEVGLIGVSLLLLLLVAITRRVLSGRSVIDDPVDSHCWMWAGGATSLVYLAVHSGFDFLWHVPVVVLVAAILLGLCSPPPLAPLSTTTNQPEELP